MCYQLIFEFQRKRVLLTFYYLFTTSNKIANNDFTFYVKYISKGLIKPEEKKKLKIDKFTSCC